MADITDGKDLPTSVLDRLFQPGYKSLHCVSMVKRRVNYLGICCTKPVGIVNVSKSMYDVVKTGRRQQKSTEDLQQDDMEVEEYDSEDEKELRLLVTGNNQDQKVFSSSLDLNRPMVICVDNIQAHPKGLLPSSTQLTSKLVEEIKNTEETETPNALLKESSDLAGVYIDVDEVLRDVSVGDTSIPDAELETSVEDCTHDEGLLDIVAIKDLQAIDKEEHYAERTTSYVTKQLNNCAGMVTIRDSEVRSCQSDESIDMLTLEPVQPEQRTTNTDVEATPSKADTFNIFEQMSSLSSKSMSLVTEIYAPVISDKQETNNTCSSNEDVLQAIEHEESPDDTSCSAGNLNSATLDKLNNKITTPKRIPVEEKQKTDSFVGSIKDQSKLPKVQSEYIERQRLKDKQQRKDFYKNTMEMKSKSLDTTSKKLNDDIIVKITASNKNEMCTSNPFDKNSVNAQETKTKDDSRQMGNCNRVDTLWPMPCDFEGSGYSLTKTTIKEKNCEVMRQIDKRMSVEKGHSQPDLGNEKVSSGLKSKQKWNLNDKKSESETNDDCLPTMIRPITEKIAREMNAKGVVKLCIEKRDINSKMVRPIEKTDKSLSLKSSGKFETAKDSSFKKSVEDEPNSKADLSIPSSDKENENSSHTGKYVNHSHKINRHSLTISVSGKLPRTVVFDETDLKETKALESSNKNESNTSIAVGKKTEVDGILNNKKDDETKQLLTGNEMSPDGNDAENSRVSTKISSALPVKPLAKKVHICPCCKKALYLSVQAFNHHKVYCEKHAKQFALRETEIKESCSLQSGPAKESGSDVLKKKSKDELADTEHVSNPTSEVKFLVSKPIGKSDIVVDEPSKTAVKSDNEIPANHTPTVKFQSSATIDNDGTDALKSVSNSKKTSMLLCNICNRAYSKTREQLANHMEHVHKLYAVSKEEQEPVTSSHGEENQSNMSGASSNVGHSRSQVVRKCDICKNKYFLTQDSLDQHLKDYHKENTKNKIYNLKKTFTKLIEKTESFNKPEDNSILNSSCDVSTTEEKHEVVLPTSAPEQESCVKLAENDNTDVPQSSDSATSEQCSNQATTGSPKQFSCSICCAKFRYISQLKGHIHRLHRYPFSPGDFRKKQVSPSEKLNNNAKKVPADNKVSNFANSKPSHESANSSVLRNHSVRSTVHVPDKKTSSGSETLKRKIEETTSVTHPSTTVLTRNDNVPAKLRKNNNIPDKSRESAHKEKTQEDGPPRKRRPSMVGIHSPIHHHHRKEGEEFRKFSPEKKRSSRERSFDDPSMMDIRSPTRHRHVDEGEEYRKFSQEKNRSSRERSFDDPSMVDIPSPTRHRHGDEGEEYRKLSKEKKRSSRERSSDEPERSHGTKYEHLYRNSSSRRSRALARRGGHSFRRSNIHSPHVQSAVMPRRRGQSGRGRGRGRGRAAYNNRGPHSLVFKCRMCSGPFRTRFLLLSHIKNKGHFLPKGWQP